MGEIFFKWLFALVLIIASLFLIFGNLNNNHDVFLDGGSDTIPVNNNVITGFAVHPTYAGFSAPEAGFVVSGNSLSVTDDVVYKTGYYSINGAGWNSFTFSGSAYGASTVWLTGKSTYTLPNFGVGEHYVIIYSCKYGSAWDCHGSKWQLMVINNSASDKYLSVDYLNVLASSAGSNDYFVVTSNTAWSVSSSPSWVTLSKTSGSGGSTVTVTASANTGVQRTGKITLIGTSVSSVSLDVIQSAGSGTTCTLGTLSNCAYCGNACASGQTCTNNQCVSTPNSSGSPVKIFIIGDSTASPYTSADYPYTGWGMMLPQYFNSQYVTVVNNAVSGASSRSYLTLSQWTQTKNSIAAGDYLFIQFAGNDESIGTPLSEFKQNLKTFADYAKSKGAYPVLLTPCERNWWSGTYLEYSHFDDDTKKLYYPNATMELAKAQSIPLIDVTTKTHALILSLGQTTAANTLFVSGDSTHYQPKGANETARIIVEGIQGLGSSATTAPLLSYMKGSTPPKTGCTPNLRECVSTNLGSASYRVCNSAGTAWTTTSCSASQICSGAGICSTPATTATCSDKIQNQGETGIDCGGPCLACSTGTGTCATLKYNCGTAGGVSCGTCPTGLSCSSNNLCISSAHTYYVATNGKDSNPGTIDSPWLTWQKGFSTAVAGDIVYIKGGTYTPSGSLYGVTISDRSGTASKPIYIWAYPSENPILNGASLSTSDSKEGINFGNTNYWHLKGLSVTNVKQTSSGGGIGFGLYAADNNIIENCKAYGNGGVGFYVREGSTGNLFKNCDAYSNYDQITGGDDADGWDLGFLSSGTVNTLEGCRAWNNSDDGYDLYTNEGNVIFRNCWAWTNGYGSTGQGVGWKLGPTTDKPTQTLRTITNCIAYDNNQRGFGQEDANVKMLFYNNIAYKNDEPGFYFYENNVADILRNNIAYKNGDDNLLKSNQIRDHNSWDTSGFTLDDSDFESLDATQLLRARNYDGSLPYITFLRLKTTSDLIDKGVNVGLSYLGSAPDLGPFEIK